MSKRKVNDSERIAQFSAISRLAPLGSRITLALTTKGGTDNALITVHEDRPDCPAMHLSRSGPRPRVPLGKYPLRAKLCLAADESMPNVAIYVILESGMITVDTFNKFSDQIGAEVKTAEDLGLPAPEDFDSWWPPEGYTPPPIGSSS